MAYLTTGAARDRHHGWWRVRAVDPPRYLEFEDGFADDAGNPDGSLPVTEVRVRLAEHDFGGTDMEIVWVFPSLEAMERIIGMGMDAGLTAAVGQIDQLL